MTFPPISITTSTPFVFRWSDYGLDENTTGLLEVYVRPATADVYYGDEPGPAQTITAYTQATGFTSQRVISKKGTWAGNNSWANVHPGYVFSCANSAGDDGKYVVAVEKDFVTMNADMTITPSAYTFVFTPPAIASTNGQPLLQGTGKSFVADKFNRFLETPLRFVVASGTAIMHLRYKNC